MLFCFEMLMHPLLHQWRGKCVSLLCSFFLLFSHCRRGRKEREGGAHLPHCLDCVIGWRPTSVVGDGNNPGGPWIFQSRLKCSSSGLSDGNIKKFWTLEDKKTRKSHFYLKKKKSLLYSQPHCPWSDIDHFCKTFHFLVGKCKPWLRVIALLCA